jgi:hypothetical protein
MLTDNQIYESVAMAAVNRMTEPKSEYVHDIELGEAGDFVGAFGSPGDLFGDRAAETTQWDVHPNSSWGAIAHWWTARGHDTHAYQQHLLDGNCPYCPYLEGVLNLRYLLDEGCGRCGGGSAVHDYGPGHHYDGEPPYWVKVLDWDSPEHWCQEPWERVEPAAAAFEDMYSFQVGEGFSAVWVAPLADGRYAAVIRSFYETEQDDDVRAVYHDNTYAICTDPTRPWETAVDGYRSFDEEYDRDVEPGEYDLRVLAEQCEGPARDEWLVNGPSDDTAGTNLAGAVDFVWPKSDT